MRHRLFFCFYSRWLQYVVPAVFLLAASVCAVAADYPQPTEADYVIRDFHFGSGQTLPELRIHYRTLGQPQRDGNGVVRNAVLILHGTTGSGKQFLVDEFAGELFGSGQLLDATKYFIILPDDIGHGGSSKPSDGLHAKFPNYGYLDMLEAEHRLVSDALHINHLRLVLGTSMGGMHTWLWGEQYPDFMDALMPLSSLPVEISGRNRMWRKMVSEAIRSDPAWNDGEYSQQPPALRWVGELMFLMSSNPLTRYQQAPSAKSADTLMDDDADKFVKTHDANDVLYAFESSSDYNPKPALDRIKAPLLAINSADDLINPPDLGILESEIKHVPHGRASVIPESSETRGHGTHTRAIVWKQHLEELLKQTALNATLCGAFRLMTRHSD
jgi:homoserine O-acetyltransferase/O-succinyltransferase